MSEITDVYDLVPSDTLAISVHSNRMDGNVQQRFIAGQTSVFHNPQVSMTIDVTALVIRRVQRHEDMCSHRCTVMTVVDWPLVGTA